MSTSIEVRISSHYVSLKKPAVTTRIRADRRSWRLRFDANSACARTETTYILFKPRSAFYLPHAKLPILLEFPVSPSMRC